MEGKSNKGGGREGGREIISVQNEADSDLSQY
jgi:hypothetical protein